MIPIVASPQKYHWGKLGLDWTSFNYLKPQAARTKGTKRSILSLLLLVCQTDWGKVTHESPLEYLTKRKDLFSSMTRATIVFLQTFAV